MTGKKVSETDLKALVAREISLAESDRAPASKKQARALEYYQGTMKDVPSEEGRSKAVSRDLADVMNWILPGIMRVFGASEHMAAAEPVGAEDARWAEQATNGINYVFWKDNDGYRVLYNGTWDSLLSGNGVIKTWRDDTPTTEVSFHSGLSEEELVLLLSEEGEDEIEVLEYSGPFGSNPSLDGAHEVKIKRTSRTGVTRIEAIPPEDYGKDSDAKTCGDARFQYHKDEKTRSDLIKMGFDRRKVESLGKSAQDDSEQIARKEHESENDGDPSMDLIDLYECYIRVDRDGDGVAELWQVFYAGTKSGGEILDAMEWEDETPFDDIPCSPMPHKWEAGSIADETLDVQQIKTVLLRAGLDNTYAANNPQRFVKGKISNPDELFSPSFGGAIFGEADAEVTNLTLPFVAQSAYDAINYQDQVIERRTGVSRTTMALDPDALQNQTATANQNARDAAYSQIELIARNQAELGWKKVFRKILKLEIKHQNKPRQIRMGGKPLTIDPRQWNADMDITINVGLGTGSRDRDMTMLQHVLNNQMMLTDRLAMVSPAKALDMLPFIMTTLDKSAEAAGIRSPELFYPEVSEEEIRQGKQLLEEQAKQPDPKVQMEQEKAKADIAIRQESTQADIVLGREKLQGDLALKREQLAAEMALKREQLAAELQLRRDLSMAEIQSKRELGFYSTDARAATSRVHMGGDPG